MKKIHLLISDENYADTELRESKYFMFNNYILYLFSISPPYFRSGNSCNHSFYSKKDTTLSISHDGFCEILMQSKQIVCSLPALLHGPDPWPPTEWILEETREFSKAFLTCETSSLCCLLWWQSYTHVHTSTHSIEVTILGNNFLKIIFFPVVAKSSSIFDFMKLDPIRCSHLPKFLLFALIKERLELLSSCLMSQKLEDFMAITSITVKCLAFFLGKGESSDVCHCI